MLLGGMPRSAERGVFFMVFRNITKNIILFAKNIAKSFGSYKIVCIFATSNTNIINY